MVRGKSLTESGVGCDVVLEAAGSNQSVQMAVSMLRRGGHLMEFAVFMEEVSLNWSIISLNWSIISDIKEL